MGKDYTSYISTTTTNRPDEDGPTPTSGLAEHAAAPVQGATTPSIEVRSAGRLAAWLEGLGESPEKNTLNTWRDHCMEEMSRLSRESATGMILRRQLSELTSELLSSLESVREVFEHLRLEPTPVTAKNLTDFKAFIVSLESLGGDILTNITERNFPAVQTEIEHLLHEIATGREIKTPADFDQWIRTRRSSAYSGYADADIPA